MSGVSAPGTPAQNGLLGILRSWLRAWSRESSGDHPKTRRMNLEGRMRVHTVRFAC